MNKLILFYGKINLIFFVSFSPLGIACLPPNVKKLKYIIPKIPCENKIISMNTTARMWKKYYLGNLYSQKSHIML